jgi:hypothetical protein
LDVGVNLSGPERAALKNNDLRLREAGPTQFGGQLADKSRASNSGWVTKQVISGKQGVGFSARRAVNSRRNDSKFSVRYVFSQNVTGSR